MLASAEIGESPDRGDYPTYPLVYGQERRPLVHLGPSRSDEFADSPLADAIR